MEALKLSEENIVHRILFLRSQKVMIDSDLAEIYGVTTMRLNEQVKRNLRRFPEDFMFQLSDEEWRNLTSQNAISSFQVKAKFDEQFSIVFQAIKELVHKKNEPLPPIGFKR